MTEGTADCTVAVIGAGAAGTLVAARLLDAAAGRTMRIVLIDPGPATGQGAAYSTPDGRHLLNVPAAGMSALPDRPDDFVDWLRDRVDAGIKPSTFVARARYGDYLAEHLAGCARRSSAVLERRHARVVTVDHTGRRQLTVRLDTGEALVARAAVLATGTSPGIAWAPSGLAGSDRLVVDPWAPGALEGLSGSDILLVGTGLTMVDVALSLDRPSRSVHAVSRQGVVPAVHRAEKTPPVAAPPELAESNDLATLRTALLRHVVETVRRTGDWRAAVDGLRPITAAVWKRLSEHDKLEFLRNDARTWDAHRHRMAPVTAERLAAVRETGRLCLHRGEVVAAEDTGDAVKVLLSDGTAMTVGAVVNCTGPVAAASADPLLASLLADGLARSGSAGLGLETADDGRLLGATGRRAPMWTLGALRRGGLWESTALPEIRGQAAEVAKAVLGDLFRPAVRRQTDVYGLRLTTTGRAAAAYNEALGRLLRLQGGAEELVATAVTEDPDFAVGHAALALLGHEWGMDVDVATELTAAQAASERRLLDDRERSFLTAVSARVDRADASALLAHLREYPLDALVVSVAIPTVAFGGLTSGSRTAELVESLAPAYGGDWWYAGQLAFVRQEQERWGEAEQLSSYALSLEPCSGHAVHARAHVFYETGQHGEGLRWLDGWIRRRGPQANHRAHFSWHAALHELMMGDTDAVRRRYHSQLAPPGVSGSRVLVDSGAMLWRCRMTGAWPGPLPVADVLAAAPDGWLEQPPTGFAAMHSAITLAAADDLTGLDRLRSNAAAHPDPVFRDVVAPLCSALAAVVSGDWGTALVILQALPSRLLALGGSAAQRDVVEETLVYALASAGRGDDAALLLDSRLSRRPSPLDVRRRDAFAAHPATA
ncbi:HI0933 family protein [Kribbella flavida DSM 17836]|uniref:HI0933 family protein n=1 Tax=Kribbella flavida (strain DSM 17836 / JCM 10339 / NBRC 14399) TaxID=479435 RepID=D2PS82_KRIFD|nr:FAD/NAD(P)-binding protein [Kribbella flavida]ADB31206.1 HI0933 family protein [Kribbella flavida DSM 17836]